MDLDAGLKFWGRTEEWIHQAEGPALRRCRLQSYFGHNCTANDKVSADRGRWGESGVQPPLCSLNGEGHVNDHKHMAQVIISR